MDTAYLNKLMDERSWLESILPHVNNAQATKEVEKKIKDLHEKIEKEKTIKRGQANTFLEFLTSDDQLMERLWERFMKWKEARDADDGK